MPVPSPELRTPRAARLQGIDMSSVFVPVTKCVALSKQDLPLKKMQYLYLRAAARQNRAVALLVVQPLLNDCRDLDPAIRGAALRSMASLRVPELKDSVVRWPSLGGGFFPLCVCVGSGKTRTFGGLEGRPLGFAACLLSHCTSRHAAAAWLHATGGCSRGGGAWKPGGPKPSRTLWPHALRHAPATRSSWWWRLG